MTELDALTARADAAGWDAHRRGQPAIRDIHWAYRDAIRAATHTTTDAHRTRRSTR